MKEKPWPIYKIKVGTPDDIAILKALRDNTDATLRVDANAAWNLETALKLIPQLERPGCGTGGAAACQRRLGRNENIIQRIFPAALCG